MDVEVVSEPAREGKPEMLARYEEVLAIAHGEMLELAMPSGSGFAKRMLALALHVPAAALARSLTELDHDLARFSLRASALRRLRHYGVDTKLNRETWRSPATEPRALLPSTGPLLVVSNHPGLFDALALFASIDRDDLAILAARRPLLEALPNLSRRFLVIDPGASGAVALKKALRHLRSGGALLHFPAGRIEPDPRIAPRERPLLLPWKPGTDALLTAIARARRDAIAIPAAVSGVISRRALSLSAIAARGGDRMTDAIVPLLQLTFPGFTDVDMRVRFGAPIPAGEGAAERLHEAITAMCEAARQAR